MGLLSTASSAACSSLGSRSVNVLPITRASSTSKCMSIPFGRSTGPSLGSRIELGGLRKKNGCFGRWLLSSVT